MRPIDIRAAVLARMTERGLSVYRLVQMLGGRVAKNTLYDYCAGRRDITGDSLGHVLAALGLDVR